MAKEMAMQQHNTQNAGKIMDSITAAKDSGAITPQEAGQLVKDHLQQQIDGGITKKAEIGKDRQSTPTPLAKAALDAAAQGRRVKAQQTDTDGNTESVDISRPGGGLFGAPIDTSRVQTMKSSDGDGTYNEVTYTPVGYRPGSSAPPLPSLDTDAAARAYQSVVDLVIRNASPSGDDFYATMNALKQLDWSDLTPVLERLVGDGPSLDGMTWLELFYERTLNMTGVDDRVLAATIAVLLGHGRVIRNASDVTKAGSLAQILLRLPGEDQVKVLERLGVRDEAAEGALAILSAAAIQGGLMQSPIAAGAINFDFGDWDLPDGMPVPFYIGTAAHLAIAAFYRTEHPEPEHYVASNFVSVQSIVDKLVNDFGFTPGQIDTKYLARMPDIFEFSTIHVPPGRVYEIKPWTLAGVAEAEAGMYFTALTQAHIPVVLGEMGFPGTEGFVPAPNGYFLFESPAEGVIAYQYLQASPAEIDARDRARGRKSSRRLTTEALQAAIPVTATAGFIGLATALVNFLLDYGFSFALTAI
jgi:hypothetical protein